MAVTKADLSKLKDEIVTSLKDELKITIKEEIKDAMREFENHIFGEIRQLQKSIEDLDATAKENKDEIKSLMDRTQTLETKNTKKDNRIKELTDEINDTQQHQRLPCELKQRIRTRCTKYGQLSTGRLCTLVIKKAKTQKS